MSTFKVPVVRVSALEPIPDADAIEQAVIGDYRSVVRKGTYQAGDLAIYLPEAALLPEKILKDIDLWDEEKGIGKLSGPDGNRIKAIKLRGVVSQGILYKPDATLVEGDDWAERLGVTKYEPRVPAKFAGQVLGLHGYVPGYDIENRKAYPDILQEGEEVVYSEKLHGSCFSFGFIYNDKDGQPFFHNSELFLAYSAEHCYVQNAVYVGSKGLVAQGLLFKDNEFNSENIYVKAIRNMPDVVDRMVSWGLDRKTSVHVKSEIFGSGVQDLTYGLKKTEVRGFDVAVGTPGNIRWLDFYEKKAFFEEIGLPMVDILYVGPYNKESLYQYRDGPTVTGKGAHIREGIVITPVKERYHRSIGRVILKEVSNAYLLRKGNVTEFN